VGVDIILAIRAVSLPVLLAKVGIGIYTTVDKGGSSGMVHISIAMRRNCRYVGRVSRSSRVVIVGVRIVGVGIVGVGIVGVDIILAIRAVSLPVLLAKVGIGIYKTVDKGGSSGMVHISVAMRRNCRYVGRVSRSSRVVIVRVGIVGVDIILTIRAVSLPVLLSKVSISIYTAVDKGGGSGVVHISIAMSRNCRYVSRVSISGRVVVGIRMSFVASVVRIGMGVDGCGIMKAAADHGRTCRSTHMNLVSTPFISAIAVIAISMTVVAISITVVAISVVRCITVISSITPICASVTTIPSIAAIASISSIAAITAIAPVAIIAVSVPVVGSLNC